MQIDSTGVQQNQDLQPSQLKPEEQEEKMDTSDDHAVEQQLLMDVSQPTQQEAASTSSNSAAADSLKQESFVSTATSLDTSRELKMPPSEYELLCDALKANPYHTATWSALVQYSERSKDVSKIMHTYDWLLEHFPNTPAIQIAYLKHFTDATEKDSQDLAQVLFKRFLPRSASPELFHFYLLYVRKINSSRQNFNATMQKSFEFALSACGQDKDAGAIWSAYIAFVKGWDVSSGQEAYANRRNELRGIYKRAVSIPLENLEQLWKDYEEFENLDKQGAREQLRDASPSRLLAKKVRGELREYLKPISPAPSPSTNISAVIANLPKPPHFDIKDRHLRDNWVKYLLWEQANPMEYELDSVDGKKKFISRLKGVYRRAVVRMRFYSEMWFWYYNWNSTLDPSDRVVQDPPDILKEGIKANPLSCMLNFALAEVYERQGQKEDAETILRTFLEKSYEDLLRIETRITTEAPKTEGEGSTLPNGNGAVTNGVSAPTDAEDTIEKLRGLLKLRVREVGQGWIVYLRFAWRSKGFQDMRNVFREARTDEKKYPSRFLDWRVWDFAARTEYHRGRDSAVATKIYETGLKKLGKDVNIDYVIHYLKFLIDINDSNNAKALFERTITNYTAQEARPLWAAWWKFEYYFTDVEQSVTLDKRLAEAFPEELATKRLGLRHSYEFDAIATKDRGSITPENSAAQLAMLSGTSSEVNSPTTSTAPQTIAAAVAAAAPPPAPPSAPRRTSPERRRRDDSPGRHGAPPAKRARPLSPPPSSRERYDPPPRRRGSPGWERERERSRERERERERDDAPSRRFEREREESRDRPPANSVPSLISWFLGTLPRASAFDGPVFRTEDLMSVLRSATIPNGPPVRARSPPYRGGGRPPPDYGPYRGPASAPPPRRW